MGRSRNYYAYRERSRLKKLWLLLEKCAYAFLAFLRRLAPAAKSTAHAPPQNTGLPPCVSRVMADAKELFPGQAFHLDTEWNSDYTLDAVPLYANLFSHYDIIQGYATDVAWPYLAGVENYIGFEHGTIRDLPHADTDNKRLALLGYARGKALYVTNIDSLGAAQYITRRSGTPIVCGLHGIGIQRLLDKMELAKHAKKDGRFGVPDGTPVFLCPSRHDFLPDEGVFLKGDDVYLPAAARLAREGQDFVLVLVNWGADVEKTRAIIHSYPELKEHIRWTQPLGKTELYLAFCQVDAVLDQLYAPVFGGIAIEVLSAAHSLLIAHKVDEDLCRNWPATALLALRGPGRYLRWYEARYYTAAKGAGFGKRGACLDRELPLAPAPAGKMP